ncbi:unnamed protein product [Rhizophagus irregularis]|uniref:MATA-HMG n=1 Tax=Rhizophagus irregularis TaxID=588596 RepID=A0A2I1G0N1_9GLOM|nr:hypothetical protein RhiirA4_394367 [Rhizophagus irregularis]CAB4410761.1 unnamed protein product [Rhizophagus irregularis]
MDVDNGFESFKQLFSSTAVLVVNPPNNTPFVELDRVRPLTPPSALDLVPEDIAGYRDSNQFYGMKVYRRACILRAQDQGLNLSPSEISLMASNLWGNESAAIKQVYINIAVEAAHINNYHNGQFPEHKCEGCPNHKHNA